MSTNQYSSGFPSYEAKLQAESPRSKKSEKTKSNLTLLKQKQRQKRTKEPKGTPRKDTIIQEVSMEERKPDISLSSSDSHHSKEKNEEIDRKLEEVRKEYALEQNIAKSMTEYDAETPLTITNRTNKSLSVDIQDSVAIFNFDETINFETKEDNNLTQLQQYIHNWLIILELILESLYKLYFKIYDYFIYYALCMTKANVTVRIASFPSIIICHYAYLIRDVWRPQI